VRKKILRVAVGLLAAMGMVIAVTGPASAAPAHTAMAKPASGTTDCPYYTLGIWEFANYTGPHICIPSGSPHDQNDLTKVYYPGGGPDVGDHAGPVANNDNILSVILCSGHNGPCTYVIHGQSYNLVSHRI
jgi:hypothetical protein